MGLTEELAYWYLRFNGFFLINNFVIHRTQSIKYSSDIDLLGVRFPYVFEKIGGKTEDWDINLINNFNPQKILGVICEVKTGGYDINKIFHKRYLKYAIERFGFIPNISDYSEKVINRAVTDISDKFQIGKILIANEVPQKRQDLIFISITKAREFLEARLMKYIEQKNQDRLFFDSNCLAEFIDRINHKMLLERFE